MKPDHFDFFFDIASGYSYLASSQVQPLAQRTGVRARWRPFLLGAAFKETGNDTPARIPAKAAWLVRDMALWARQYGMPLAFPSRFPFSSVTALRLLVAAGRLQGEEAIPRLAHPLFEAAWGLDQDINQGRTARQHRRSGEARRVRRAGLLRRRRALLGQRPTPLRGSRADPRVSQRPGVVARCAMPCAMALTRAS
jgi:2-hydroxychromene-2-carboxylate isomerase